VGFRKKISHREGEAQRRAPRAKGKQKEGGKKRGSTGRRRQQCRLTRGNMKKRKGHRSAVLPRWGKISSVDENVRGGRRAGADRRRWGRVAASVTERKRAMGALWVSVVGIHLSQQHIKYVCHQERLEKHGQKGRFLLRRPRKTAHQRKGRRGSPKKRKSRPPIRKKGRRHLDMPQKGEGTRRV